MSGLAPTALVLRSRRALAQEARRHGLARVADALAELALPAVQLVPLEGQPRPARSKLGGTPDLSPDTPWPRRDDGAPLTFLAQIDLAEVAAQAPSDDLPDAGVLLFFWDEEDYEGRGPEHGTSVVIFHDREPTSLERAAEPEDIDSPRFAWELQPPLTMENVKSFRFRETPVAFRTVLTIPDQMSFDVERLLGVPPGRSPVGEAEWGCYYDLVQAVTRRALKPDLHLLGWAHLAQEDPRYGLELLDRGLTWRDAVENRSLWLDVAAAGARNWRLLLDLGWDGPFREAPGWGDMGNVNFYIPTDDLPAGRFNRVRAVMTCS